MKRSTWLIREIVRVKRDRDHWRRKVARARTPNPVHVDYVARLDARVDELLAELEAEKVEVKV